MIEREILKILSRSEDDGEGLNNFADGFRANRSPHELLALLASENDEVVAAGVWVLGEMATERYDSEVFRQCLKALLGHESDMVRYYSIGALISIADDEIESLFVALQNDPNEGVRNSAKAAVSRLSKTK